MLAAPFGRRFPFSLPRTALLVFEIALVIGFAAWVTWPYLGGTPKTVLPAGGDYVVSIQGRYFWEHVRECGTCALWNGDIAGGSPALIDTSSDLLHPMVAIITLLFGVAEGSRILVALTVIVSALGSWWLAYLLQTSTVARIFAGCLGAAGGHMTGRLSFGLVVLMTSIATASLLVPALILLGRNPDRRNTAITGALLGVTLVSGQAYIQIGVLLLSPAMLLLFIRRGYTWKLVLLRLGQMGAMALLLSALLLLPMLHFHAFIDKDFDPYFSRSQPFRYVPLNLVIDRLDYFSSSMFKEVGFPAWHVNYIGWIPIIFAIAGIAPLWRRSKNETLFCGALVFGALWLGSGDLFKWIGAHPSFGELREHVVRLRTTSNIANLAVPAIIGFSACGIAWGQRKLDRLMRFRFSLASQRHGAKRVVQVGLGLALIVPLFFSVHDVFQSARQWNRFIETTTTPFPAVTSALRSPELRWVNGSDLSFELSFFALENGLKLGNQWQPWRIQPPRSPLPAVIVSNSGQPEGTQLIDTPPGLQAYAVDGGNPYARVSDSNGQGVNCRATGRGAKIDVACPQNAFGPLTIQERFVDGWTASIAGDSVPIVDHDGWIGIDLPVGAPEIELRFHSPYLRSSLLLTILGAIWVIWWIAFPGFLSLDGSRMRTLFVERFPQLSYNRRVHSK
jgi:hypothetical protein